MEGKWGITAFGSHCQNSADLHLRSQPQATHKAVVKHMGPEPDSVRSQMNCAWGACCTSSRYPRTHGGFSLKVCSCV